MKINKLFFLVLGLSMICGGLIIWRLFFYTKPVPETFPLIPTKPTRSTVIISPTPTQTGREIGDSEKEIINSLKTNFPLVEFVPFENENFKIDYRAALTLGVVIKKGGKQDVEKQVLSWIKSKGVDPATHKIEYLTPELSPAL